MNTEAAGSQGMAKAVGKPPEAKESPGKIRHMGFTGDITLPTLCTHLASRTVRQNICVVISFSVCGTLLQQP